VSWKSPVPIWAVVITEIPVIIDEKNGLEFPLEIDENSASNRLAFHSKLRRILTKIGYCLPSNNDNCYYLNERMKTVELQPKFQKILSRIP
jgi:hypothetical protein